MSFGVCPTIGWVRIQTSTSRTWKAEAVLHCAAINGQDEIAEILYEDGAMGMEVMEAATGRGDGGGD